MVRCSSKLGTLTANAVSHLMSHLTWFCVPLCVPFRFVFAPAWRESGTGNQSKHVVTLSCAMCPGCCVCCQSNAADTFELIGFILSHFSVGLWCCLCCCSFFLRATRKTSFRRYEYSISAQQQNRAVRSGWLIKHSVVWNESIQSAFLNVRDIFISFFLKIIDGRKSPHILYMLPFLLTLLQSLDAPLVLLFSLFVSHTTCIGIFTHLQSVHRVKFLLNILWSSHFSILFEGWFFFFGCFFFKSGSSMLWSSVNISTPLLSPLLSSPPAK